MIFRSAGTEINLNTVTYRSLGFGEKSILETKKYEMTINNDEFPEQFISHANSFIAECKIDDSEQGYADIPELEKIEYPTFDEILNNYHNLAASLIKDYLYFELFYFLFPNSKELKIVINSIENIKSDGTSITITGETYPVQKT
ncbi:hypothetical protein SAMN04488483_0312 [Pseudomonas helmanticensis]|uniref:Uncharacterized protein n=1 Tax=Pseudomonas helmanticensis TaxID=1471381 RepID=A0ACD2TZL0_9PSED|nr:hypothetical protein [Pseudomonas helmanticensis]SMQ22404.1 hypothetical protein SAMN04488483_0312 [Pseudomonas helmanticensis]